MGKGEAIGREKKDFTQDVPSPNSSRDRKEGERRRKDYFINVGKGSSLYRSHAASYGSITKKEEERKSQSSLLLLLPRNDKIDDMRFDWILGLRNKTGSDGA